MKKLLIATTALVATAGMASADITISGHAAAGIHSGLDNKAPTAAVVAADATSSKDLTVRSFWNAWRTRSVKRNCSFKEEI